RRTLYSGTTGRGGIGFYGRRSISRQRDRHGASTSSYCDRAGLRLARAKCGRSGGQHLDAEGLRKKWASSWSEPRARHKAPHIPALITCRHSAFHTLAAQKTGRRRIRVILAMG